MYPQVGASNHVKPSQKICKYASQSYSQVLAGKRTTTLKDTPVAYPSPKEGKHTYPSRQPTNTTRPHPACLIAARHNCASNKTAESHFSQPILSPSELPTCMSVPQTTSPRRTMLDLALETKRIPGAPNVEVTRACSERTYSPL